MVHSASLRVAQLVFGFEVGWFGVLGAGVSDEFGDVHGVGVGHVEVSPEVDDFCV